MHPVAHRNTAAMTMLRPDKEFLAQVVDIGSRLTPESPARHMVLNRGMVSGVSSGGVVRRQGMVYSGGEDDVEIEIESESESEGGDVYDRGSED